MLVTAMLAFWLDRNAVVTVTTPTRFLLRLRLKANNNSDFASVTLVTVPPTTERALALLRGRNVTPPSLGGTLLRLAATHTPVPLDSANALQCRTQHAARYRSASPNSANITGGRVKKSPLGDSAERPLHQNNSDAKKREQIHP